MFGYLEFLFQNLVIDKVCRVNLEFNSTICDDLTSFKDAQTEVQQIASTVSMYMTIFGTIPTIFTSLILGPWSDGRGRKPIMVTPMIGLMIGYALLLLNVFFDSWKAELNILGKMAILGYL